jgi:hypothetical protein
LAHEYSVPTGGSAKGNGLPLRLDVSRIDCGSIPAGIDYGAIVALARQSGVEFGEVAIREAFQLMMRARCLAVSGVST